MGTLGSLCDQKNNVLCLNHCGHGGSLRSCGGGGESWHFYQCQWYVDLPGGYCCNHLHHCCPARSVCWPRGNGDCETLEGFGCLDVGDCCRGHLVRRHGTS